MYHTLNRSGRWGQRARLLALLFIALVFIVSPAAFAHQVSALVLRRPPPLLTTPRDPAEFLADLSMAAPRPLVPLTIEDAVAGELLQRSHSLSELDALRTAEALCDEARLLHDDPLLYVALIHVESHFDHLAVSPSGAEGLMQLLPSTAEWMAREAKIEWPDRNSFDPVLNVRLGARYLSHLRHRLGRLESALTAYNRGPTATRFLLREHGRVPDEIRGRYSDLVIKRYQVLWELYGHLPLG